MKPRLAALTGSAALVAALATAGAARADQTELCVTCADPQQTYVCRVDTPRGSPGEKALQLFCIIKTAKEGGHSSCAVRRDTGIACEGTLKSFSYNGPAIPEALRSAAQQPAPGERPAQGSEAIPQTPPQKGGEPETLVEMTSRAVGASKDGVRATGRAVRNVAGGTGHAIGNIGKKAGKQVGKAARGAKSAARVAYDCLTSFFKDCSTSE
jgi:hypothetical protein